MYHHLHQDSRSQQKHIPVRVTSHVFAVKENRPTRVVHKYSRGYTIIQHKFRTQVFNTYANPRSDQGNLRETQTQTKNLKLEKIFKMVFLHVTIVECNFKSHNLNKISRQNI